MSITKIPGLYYDENAEYERIGTGAKIPVIIGKTGNSAATGYSVDGTQMNKFTGWDEVNRTIANGGIGTDTSTNPVLAFLKDFFEEAAPIIGDDLSIPYVYVIDVGAGTAKTSWTNALTTAKTATEATVEVYVNADNITDYALDAFITGADVSIKGESNNLNLRTGFVTKPSGTDAQLIALNPTSGGILSSRMFICEPLKFGKCVARFCTTPYWVEPGYLNYRTVEPGTFNVRSNTEELALQNAGIVFSHDEKIDTDTYVRINLSTSTAFAKSPRPADALGHAKFNADHLLREIFKAVYPQVKDNETASAIVKKQTKVDAIIDAEVEAERMIPYNPDTQKGTKLTLTESSEGAGVLDLLGQIHPVNCTAAINIKAQIKTAN